MTKEIEIDNERKKINDFMIGYPQCYDFKWTVSRH